MFAYKSDQKIVKIGDVKIGGLPGKNATALIGSIFYTRDKMVKNAETGEFDASAVENVLNQLEDLTEKTGLPTILDVVASSEIAMDKYLSYLVDATEFPLLIDGSDSLEVNTAGIMTAKEGGFLDRVAINSLSPTTKSQLYEVVKETGLRNAVLLTFSADALISYSKRVEIAESLIQKVMDAGVTNILIDTGVIDIPSLGIACRTQQIIKDKFGYPVGNGAHNAVSTWTGLKTKFSKEAKKPAFVGSILMPVSLGADFVLYGPAKHAPIVYPAVAMIDTALSGALMEDGIRPERPHPRFLIG